MLNIEINVKEAVQKTLEVAKSKKESEDKFGNYAPIYMAPTGNVKDTIGLYKDNNIKKALVVGSQGSFAYELALKTNVEEIDCFDKNILQYLFFELYNTALKNCTFKDFKTNFTSEKMTNGIQKFNNMLSEYLFFDLLDVMGGGYARDYWAKLFMSLKDFKNIFTTNLFRTYYPLYIDYLNRYSSVYNASDFYKLQNILKKNGVKINYHICDIDELHKIFENKKYDLIVLGNILQYYKSIPKLDNPSAVNRFVDEKWNDLLNNNGKIQLGYGFEVITAAVNQMLGKNNPNFLKIPDKLFWKINEQYIKSEFIPNMIKKYEDKYSLDYIPGVEQEDGYMGVENIILTYKKK